MPSPSRPPLPLLAAAALLLSLLGCAHAPAPAARPVEIEKGTAIELVESSPIETNLDHADIPDAYVVWKEMIDSATKLLDIAEFYTSDEPPSRLTPIVESVLAAAARGVRVRFLIDESFAGKYPETLHKLGGVKNLELRRLPVQAHMGGVLHAKYFIVDKREAYLGSQNFDWRSLEHIQEMGVRIRSKSLAAKLVDVFATDWELAGQAPDDYRSRRSPGVWASRFEGGEVVHLVASPKGWLPDESAWDLPRIIQAIDGAKESVGVQLLTYKTKNHDGSAFPTLDDALRRAAARGVKVRLLVSDWSNKPASDARRAITELNRVPNVEVKVITIPLWSGGEIPFARVCHSKFLVADGRVAWVGTSNWEGDYFFKSRNVGVMVESVPFTERLTRVLDDAWESTYAKPVQPMPEGERPVDDPNKRRWKKVEGDGEY